jgi:hypothetical protein
MAHESFEDRASRGSCNADFVPVKVDREERPDVDAVYMAATQALTGQGGWPMTCSSTPDGARSTAGTYFPPRRGTDAVVPQLLDAMRRPGGAPRRGRGAGQRIATARPGEPVTATARAAGRPAGSTPRGPCTGTYDECAAASAARRSSRRRWCWSVLRTTPRTGTRTRGGWSRHLRGDGRGGIYDQLAAVFARYSVDAGWVVPHFEKMLYDNALLSGSTPTVAATGTAGPRVALADARLDARDLRTARAASPRRWTPTRTASEG